MSRSKTITFILLIIAVLVVGIAYLYNSYNIQERSPVIETKLGKVRGLLSVSRGGRKFMEFLGVPYAQKPIFKNRFEPPKPVEKWDGILEAIEYGPECAQLRLIVGNYGGEEDCLYLNIFVPINERNEENSTFPVMVWLHGGAFVTGSSNAYRGKYFADENIILVTLNYRLAALGFLNTGDEVVRGNMGLKDQVMALQFIKENIHSWKGDPSRVTLFGESAGSASTSFHLVSPLSQGLFSKAIMQSGTFAANWTVFPDPAKQAKRFASKFGCAVENTTEMVDCMRNLDVRTLVQAHEEILAPLREQITVFVPTIEAVNDKHSFLTEHPMVALAAGRVNKVPVLAGVNSEEGLLTSAIITSNQSKLEQANNEYNFWAARLLYYPQGKTDISTKVRKFYFGDVENIASQDLIRNFTNLFSDRLFFLPLHDFGRLYKSQASLRLYFYAYQGQFSLARLLISSQKPYFPVIFNVIMDMVVLWVKQSIFGLEIPHPGVCHADELPLFYNLPLSFEITESSKDYDMSIALVKLWASFAKDDNTLIFRHLDNTVRWDQLEAKDTILRYMKLDESPKMIDEPFSDRVKFWKSLGV